MIAAACLIPGVLLLLVGIAGLHLRQRHASGKMGVIGIGLMFLGIALVATAYLALYGAVLSFVGGIFFQWRQLEQQSLQRRQHYCSLLA
ncbi:MAG: hypothetical protein H0T39_06265 [Actinobacteria bacterium]|nr:hypothetical protein [Actinomycetota bacterium]